MKDDVRRGVDSLATPERPVDRFGKNLIFLISQPRSGSTLLQYMLAGHPRIHTLPEPWFMLHFLYANRPDGIAAEYNARTAQRALANFLSALEAGDQSFIESVRAGAGYLYSEALKGSGADIFLDKSPRYYFIAKELRAVFPRAHLIFLIRNPLAVLSSILHTHATNDWTVLRRLDQMHDLVTAPRSIMNAIEDFQGEGTAVVHYEELVHDPDSVLADLCLRMEIENVPDLKTYVATESPLGDRKSVAHSAPVTKYIDNWKRDLDSSAKRDVANSYLRELGADLLQRLGYDYDDLLGQLEPNRRETKGSRWKMLVTADQLLPWWQRMRLGFVHSRQQRGLMKTLLRMAYIAVSGHAWVHSDPRDHIDRRPV